MALLPSLGRIREILTALDPEGVSTGVGGGNQHKHNHNPDGDAYIEPTNRPALDRSSGTQTSP